ncbi:MAG: 50S ribosomal protein L17 [candidate division TM6 bacterium GW2011_GWF2_38_10]|nr:MAG: 50S ribosomal protein L17 [candidate division TM6 bacterium GW2011_GWF2_38_10]
MNHQNGRKKLNLRSSHRKALLRNQVIHFIRYGFLQTTKAKAKEVQKLAEHIVTIARAGYDFNTIRRIKQMLPYDEAMVKKMIKEVAPKYIGRPGGYTRLINLGQRPSDTAKIARLEWV